MKFGKAGRWFVVGIALLAVVGLSTSSPWTTQAQDRPGRPEVTGKTRKNAVNQNPSTVFVSAQDALIRPFDFPFKDPIPLSDAVRQIGRTLGFPVALDQAALDRQDVEDDEPVKLELAGVRLKVGLKLLLDPLHLTVKVVPEDNLLIITDAEGSDDPAVTSLAELKVMHREIHDLQDAVDDLRDLVEEELGYEPDDDTQGPSLVHHARRVRHLSRIRGPL